MLNLINQEAVASTTVSISDIRPQWKALAADRKNTKEDIVALVLYRSMLKGGVKEDVLARLRKSFKPITNIVKLDNGAYPYGSLQEALRMVKYSTVIQWLTPDEGKALLALAQDALKDVK